MTKGISGDALIPAERTEHVNILACTHAGGSIKEIKYNRIVTLCADIAILKNKIYIDKLMKRLMAQTKSIL